MLQHRCVAAWPFPYYSYRDCVGTVDFVFTVGLVRLALRNGTELTALALSRFLLSLSFVLSRTLSFIRQTP